MQIQKYTKSEPLLLKLKRYFISRSDPYFWKVYDWFEEYFYRKDPLSAGVYDLNPYAPVSDHALEKIWN